MSNVIKFLKGINENEEIREEVETKEKEYSLRGKETKVNYKFFLEKEIIPIAKKYGCSFTADDYIKFMNDNSTQLLNEDELEGVAGGKRGVVLPSVMAALTIFQGPLSQSMKTYAMNSEFVDESDDSNLSSNDEENQISEKETSKDLKLSKEEIQQIGRELNTITVNEDINYSEYAYDDHFGGERMATLLHIAAQKNAVSVVNLLISKGVNIDIKDKKGETPLHIAARFNSEKVAELLISRGADINAVDETGYTPLHGVGYHNAIKIAELLISKGADINAKTIWGYTPLHIVTAIGKVELMELLISRGADVNAVDKYGRTPMYNIRTFQDRIEKLDLLMSKGADINAKDNDGNTPLHFNVTANVKFAKSLISKGADINAKNNKGLTPLLYAHDSGGEYGAIEFLLSKGAELDSKNMRSIFNIALNKGYPRIVEQLILRGVKLDKRDESRLPSLHDVGVTGAAMSLGVGIDKIDSLTAEEKKELLIWAVTNDIVNMTKLLISKGAKVDNGFFRKVTPLHYAAKGNAVKVAQWLISEGANINEKDPDGKTPLHWAAEHGAVDVVELLIDKGAKINEEDNKGDTPLHYTANLNVVKLLINKGADINEIIKGRCFSILSVDRRALNDLIIWAAESGNWSVVKLLVEKKGESASIHVRDNDGLPLVDLKIAARYSSNENRYTLLHWAAQEDSDTVASILISNGADINAKEFTESTPLHIAAWHNAYKVAELLISNGADINAKDSTGQTPIQIAEKNNSIGVAELLKQKRS